MTASPTLVMNHLFGYFPSQVTYTAATLGIADHLAAGASTADEVATAAGTDPANTGRLLRSMVFLGLVDEPDAGRFVLNDEGAVLRSDGPQSMRSWVRLFASNECWRSWGELTWSVRTGGVAWDELFGQSAFEYMDAHPELGVVFHDAMASGTRRAIPGIVAATDLSTAGTIVDVGGGNGALLAALLRANPAARGVVFDTAGGVAAAPALLEAEGVADRTEIVAGDFFATVPAGADAYVIKSVVHDWNDERAGAILRVCRAAMKEDARLLVVEPIMPTTMTAAPELFGMVMSDLNMMVVAGGRERTDEEFRTLITGAGFTVTGVTPCPGPTTYQVIEAVPAW